MGQVELQPEPILSEGQAPSGADFSSEIDPFSSNLEVSLSGVTPILNAESIVVLDSKDGEYSGWVPDERVSPVLDNQPKSRLRSAFRRVAVPAGGAIAALLVACGGGNEGSIEESPTSIPTQRTEEISTVIKDTPTPELTLSPSVEPTVGENPNIGKGVPETETPSPEIVVETPCQILPEEFCKQAEVINYKTEGNKDTVILGFKDVPEGAPVITPVTGEVTSVDFSNGTSGGWEGNGVIINLSPDGTEMALIIGDLNIDSVGFRSQNTGEQVATVGSSGVDNFGYKILVQLIIQEGQKFEDNDKAYNLYFPEVIKKEPVGEISRSQTQATFAGYDFVD